jgi:hypothetical protein
MFAGSPVAILDEIDGRDGGKIVLRGLIQKRKWAIAVCVRVKRPRGQIREHIQRAYPSSALSVK